VPGGRGSPEQVDGDLIELSPEVLAQLRGEIARVDAPHNGWFPQAAGATARSAILNKHHGRYSGQQTLRKIMGVWGTWREITESTREAQKRFYLTFGVDYMTAQTLDADKAAVLETRIREQLVRNNITEATA
jgi:hypothetical protein